MEPIRERLSSQIPELFEEHVKIADLEILDEKLKKISEDGKDKLQVLTDFDSTLTQFFVDGKPLINSFEIFAFIPGAPKVFLKKCKEHLIKYSNTLEDTSQTIEEKSKIMDQIFIELTNVMSLLPMKDSSVIDEEAGKNRFLLRKGMEETFTRLKDGSIPITVVSAGMGQIIDFLLKSKGIFYDNVNVVANYLLFSDGRLIGFRDKPIHSYNKNMRLTSYSSFKKLNKRENVILIGDMVPDSNMADSASDTAQVIKIAFFNPTMKGDLADFLKAFDIVIVGDKGMDVINAILRHIL